MATSMIKQVLLALIALPMILFATGSYACQVVGFANGEPLCATTSDATGFNNAQTRPGFWNRHPRQQPSSPAVSPTGAPLAPRCPSGLVWRGAANAGDGVCVTPQQRTNAQLQNANAANNMAGGGAYGPNTCRQGYVWREAFAGDTVCVTPYERSEAQQENARRRR